MSPLSSLACYLTIESSLVAILHEFDTGDRSLHLTSLLVKKSYFLLGPRQTGKSFLIAQTFRGTRLYDLLDTSIYLTLSQRPKRLAEELTSNDLKSLKALAEERKLKRYLCVSLEARRRKVGEVTILPIHEFVNNLWNESYS
ncbi:MAG: hypothetical protein IPM58_10000 [Nitrospira sp.]|nr:hypothetical protein [Nitrospira sp.]